MFEELPLDEWTASRQAFSATPLILGTVYGQRGELDELRLLLDRFAPMDRSGDEQERSSYRAGLARLQLANGDLTEALASGEEAFLSHTLFGFGAEQVKDGFTSACEAALLLGETAKLAELLAVVDGLSPGSTNDFLRAQSFRFRVHLARDGDPAEAEQLFRQSCGLLADLAATFPLAVVQTEHGTWLVDQGRAGEAEPLLGEARPVFARLGALPWLERVDRLGAGVEAA